MAKRKRRRKAGKKRKSNKGLPGWAWMFFGLGIGLAVAGYIYIGDIRASGQSTTLAAVRQPEPERAPTPVEATEEETDEFDFDFYEMLPNLDVEIFEDPRQPARNEAPTTTATTPGIYILQAGSFRYPEDANRRKAQLGLLGLAAEIREGDANGRTVYRVYTKPMKDTAEVNRVSKMLQQEKIEVLVKRVK